MLKADKLLFWIVIPISSLYACLTVTEVILLDLPSWLVDFLLGFPFVAGLICFGLCFEFVKIYFYPGSELKFKDCLQVFGFSIIPGSSVVLICILYFGFRKVTGVGAIWEERALFMLAGLLAFQLASVIAFALLRLKFRFGG
jgi:hypothetical protein